ncbi:MAG: M15 family metallopeptidase [Neisseriaceae bacterium]
MSRILLYLIMGFGIANAWGIGSSVVYKRPDNFVNVKEVIPQMQMDIRYYTNHNFVGRRINGYLAPVCLLTKQSANALKVVEDKLLAMGLTLKAYDCYRPQRAVDDFVNWAKQLNNTTMKAEFYPTVDKNDLFKDGYIASPSSHSRGSTLDLTIVPVTSLTPLFAKGSKLVSCTAPYNKRFPDNGLDFGTGFDCFSPVAHPDYQDISAQAKANRLLLQSLMKQAGFKPLDTEWWHFTLVNEPYPNTYFDFPVQ